MTETPRSQTSDKGWTAPSIGSLRSTDAKPLQIIFTSLREHIKTMNDSTSSNTSSIATNTANIATNTTNIATNTASINSLTTTVSQNTPTGVIFPYSGVNAPTGWLLCAGTDVSRTTYSALFGIFSTSFVGATTTNASATVSGLSGMSATTHVGWGIAGNGIPTGATITAVTNATTVTISANATVTQTGTASLVISPYGFTGANNTTTFLLPDLRGRVIAGKDNMGGTSANRLTAPAATLNGIDGDFLGRVGGSETHTLTTAQMPSHTHNYYPWFGSYAASAFAYGLNPYAGLTQPTSATGGDAAHNNVQPSIILNYIIKT